MANLPVGFNFIPTISIRQMRGATMLEGLLQPMHLLVLLAIAVLLFGPKKLPELGRGLGEGIRGFRGTLADGTRTNEGDKRM
jgi:sec-independent protein translocase protein TatA